MRAELLFREFERIAEAPDAVGRFRDLIRAFALASIIHAIAA